MFRLVPGRKFEEQGGGWFEEYCSLDGHGFWSFVRNRILLQDLQQKEKLHTIKEDLTNVH